MLPEIDDKISSIELALILMEYGFFVFEEKMKVFNTTAVCIPTKHYMVDISEKVDEIKKLVDGGKYFTINRARQYGKTTTLTALRKRLESIYMVLSLDFQSVGADVFKNEAVFSQAMARIIIDCHEFENADIPEETINALAMLNESSQEKIKLDDFFRIMKRWINKSDRGIVLIIDEVDSATNNQVFLDFLAGLRDLYIGRETDGIPAFQSVILAGVTDVKHLKMKIRPDKEHKENSPWNIAEPFTVDMSLSETGIRGMLDEYESDHNIGMNTNEVACKIHDYTNGYPFLVSRICQLIDTDISSSIGKEAAWTCDGVEEAVKRIITESNTLFDSLMSKLKNYERLKLQLRRILLQGETIEYLPDNKEQEQLMMFGFITRSSDNTIVVANRIFEMRLYRYYIGESKFSEEMRGNALDNKPEFIKNGELDIPLIMERFIETQKYIRNLNDEEAKRKFIEEEGREKFLTYLSPILNGTGTYSIEEQTRTRKRMDIVIHYLGKRYIIELKIWHGEKYNSAGEKQIIEYLDYWNLDTGYMLSFSFNKNKTIGVKKIQIGGKILYEGIV